MKRYPCANGDFDSDLYKFGSDSIWRDRVKLSSSEEVILEEGADNGSSRGEPQSYLIASLYFAACSVGKKLKFSAVSSQNKMRSITDELSLICVCSRRFRSENISTTSWYSSHLSVVTPSNTYRVMIIQLLSPFWEGLNLWCRLEANKYTPLLSRMQRLGETLCV